jgi:hypothetical protein
MRWEFKDLKLSFQIPALFIFAVSAHVLAGGSVITAPRLIAQIFLIAVIAFILRGVHLEGPALALLITVIQSSSHFLIGGNSYTSQWAMTIGHLFSGYLSFKLISNFHIAWEKITEILRKLLLPSQIVQWSQKFQSTPLLPESDSFFPKKNFYSSLKYRGPPTRLDSNHAS